MSDTSDQDWQDLGQLVKETPISSEKEKFLITKFHLASNPFSPNGVADESGVGKPIRKQQADKIRSFITEGYQSGKAQFLVLRGDYGTGKTHILRFMENVVNTYMSGGSRAARAIYVERPRIEAHELNRTILRSLGDDTIRKYIWFAIQGELEKDLLITPSAESITNIRKVLSSPKAARGRGGAIIPPTATLWDDNIVSLPAVDRVFSQDSIKDYRLFLQALEKAGGNREIVRHYLTELLLRAIGGLRLTELASAFVAFLLSPDEGTFTSWEALLAAKSPRASSPLRAPEFLQSLLKIMRLNGIVYVFLLLDEFEEVPQGALLSPRQRQDYLYTMREIFDKIQSGLSVVMAISPPGWDALQPQATPLYDRAGTYLSLDELSVDDAIELVEFYFARTRKTAPERLVGSATSDDKLFPLSYKLVELIVANFPSSTQRTARNFIQFLHRLIDFCADHQISPVTEEVCTGLLQQFGDDKATSSSANKTRSRRGRA